MRDFDDEHNEGPYAKVSRVSRWTYHVSIWSPSCSSADWKVTFRWRAKRKARKALDAYYRRIAYRSDVMKIRRTN